MADEQAEALDEIESLAAKLERQTMNTEQVNRVNRRKNRRTLRLIHEVLSGNEWSADTAGEIAEIMVNAGFEIKEPESE
jgi:hypothetical protein